MDHVGILAPPPNHPVLAFSLKEVAKDLSNSQARAARDVKEFLEVSLTFCCRCTKNSCVFGLTDGHQKQWATYGGSFQWLVNMSLIS